MTNADTAPLPASQRYDLRRTVIDDALARVEKALDVRLELSTAVRKRRSLGAATDRGTWIRIEARGTERLDGQGWGLEAAHVLQDVAKPAWHAGISWFDNTRQVMWRADETGLVTDAPIKPGGSSPSTRSSRPRGGRRSTDPSTPSPRTAPREWPPSTPSR